MAGGRVTVRPPPADLLHSVSASGQFNVVGNTVLYGATGGQLFVRGKAGERFAVSDTLIFVLLLMYVCMYVCGYTIVSMYI